MRARSSGALMVLAVLLGALVWYQVNYPWGVTPAATMPMASAPDADADSVVTPIDDLSALETVALPALEDMTQTVERPLFSVTRRPEVDAPDVPMAAPVPPQLPTQPPTAALTAVIIQGDDRVALIQGSTSADLLRLREGQELDGWRVDSVQSDGVILSKGEQTHRLDLRTYSSVPAPAGLRTQGLARTQNETRRANRPRRPPRGPRNRSPRRNTRQ